MKTDIVESTPQFRALLATDLQAVLSNHREMVAGLAAEEAGHILKSTGDGFWLEFPSVTGAARSAIAMHEALRLKQATKGDDRLSMRVVIGLGDTATQDGEPVGDVLALITRIEAITPPDEIYLTAAACLVLMPSEIRTGIVDTFALKGFPEQIVYRVEQRHRTHVFPDAWILVSDLRGFVRFTRDEDEGRVEQLLYTLDLLMGAVTREFKGTVRFSIGDSFYVTFPSAQEAMAAAEELDRSWAAKNREQRFDCPINICLHRGTLNVFRSFVYGNGIAVSGGILSISAGLFGADEGHIFATDPVRDALRGSPWHGRLEAVRSERLVAGFPDLAVFCLQSE